MDLFFDLKLGFKSIVLFFLGVEIYIIESIANWNTIGS
jgi:hypothetical protein